MYLMCGQTYRTKTLKSGISQTTAERSAILVGWHNLEMLAVPPKDRHRHYISVPSFLQYCVARGIFRVLSPPIFAYFSSAFGGRAKRLGYLLLESAMAEFTIMSSICFMPPAEHNAAKFISAV